MKTKKTKIIKQASQSSLDFSNQILFAGIDVHKRSWNVSIQINGILIERFSMNPSPEELARHLRRNYPNGKYFSVYEAGFSGFWADRRLRELGINNIVCNPADIPTKNKERRHKTDKIDSRKLSRELSSGSLEAIYIPTEEQEAIRALARLRKQFTADQTRTKNRIKSLLNFIGIEIPENYEIKHWSGKFIKHLESTEIKEQPLKCTLEGLLENLKQERKQILGVLIKLRKFVRENKNINRIIKRIESVPGIAFITAISLYTEIIDINRFGRLDELSCFIGFVPDTESTGENEKVNGISKRHNKYLRNMLIESAWIAIRKDKALMMTYGKLIKRMSKQKAIIRIAKKLLNRIKYVWMNDKDYITGIAA